MPWDIRPSGRFYYRSVRIGKRVTRRYFGKGPMAELIAQQDAEARAERYVALQAHETLKLYLGKLDGLTEQHDQLVDLVLSGVMLGAGYHRPKFRIEWRKRLHGRTKNKAG